jgi:hypothetical protein
MVKKFGVQVKRGPGGEAIAQEEQDALAMGDLVVATLGKQEFKKLRELIFLEESCKDRIMLEGELGAS